MVDIKGTLLKKVGPLPLWAYGLIGVATIGGVWYYQKKKGGSTTPTTAAVSNSTGSAFPDTTGTSYTSDQLGTGSTDSASAGGSTGGSLTSPITGNPTTNASWFTQAANYLVGMGYDAAAVSQALNNYLTGLQASAQDQALYNIAVGHYGVPPEGIPVQPSAPSSNPIGTGSGSGTGTNGLPAPTGFSAKPTGASTIDVWWQAVPNAKSYVVWSRPYPYDAQWTTDGETPNTNLTISGKQKATTYAITVRARDTSGNLGAYPDTIFIPTASA